MLGLSIVFASEPLCGGRTGDDCGCQTLVAFSLTTNADQATRLTDRAGWENVDNSG